jgi:ribonuclease P protein component
MLPRRRRVSTALFQEVMERGKSFHASHISAFRYLYKDSLTTSHISVVVSKKTAAKATKRNALRRKLYSIIRPLESTLNTKAVALIFVKKDIADIS